MIKKKAGAKKPTAAPLRGSSGALDFEAVRELARIATEFDLSEVETDPSGRIKVARRVERVGAVAAAPVVSAPSSGLSLMPSAAAEKPAETGTLITSPFVGTFYRSPSPEAAVFVEVGQTIRKGQVVCIVEAMKLMNEIEAEFEGKIEEILVQNGEHVEYGQHLFRLSK